MAAPSRTTQFTRLHKILKKHYHAVAPDPNRSVLEHLLFACCLENAHFPIAEEAFAAAVHTFFDWNEVRVSSNREVSEVLAGLPDPSAAAHRLKRVLQSIFEATYSFELQELCKLNLGVAIERLEKIDGATKFGVAYVVQAALGGHSIPIDPGTLGALSVVGLVGVADVAASVVPGLERAIPKNAGIEFGSLLHQLGADFAASPYAPTLHSILLEIEPGAKDRLPSRRSKRPESEPAPAESQPVQAPAPAGPEETAAAVKAKKEKEHATGEAVGHSHAKPVAEKPDAAGKKKPAATRKHLPEAKDPVVKENPVKEPAHGVHVAAEPVNQEPGTRKKEKDKVQANSPEEEAAAKGKSPSPRKAAAKKKPEPPKIEGDFAASESAEGLSKRKPR